MTFNSCCYYVTYHKPFNLPDRVSNGLKKIVSRLVAILSALFWSEGFDQAKDDC